MLRPGSWTLGDKGTHYIRTIKNSSNHLATLINDILDAASMAKGKLVIKQETVNLLLYFTDLLTFIVLGANRGPTDCQFLNV